MALVPVTQYTLPFSTDTGANIVCELDIRRQYDDADPDGTPRTNAEIAAFYDWITLDTDGTLAFPPTQTLTGTAKPIEVEWERDYDVYKPIIGSKAKINLLVERAEQYYDFNEARPYEWQVRLTYEDTNEVAQVGWIGYFTALDGTENVSTFPFPASFTATDGLGLLEEAKAEPPTEIVSVKVWDAITEALIQTGLGIPIYLDSGINAVVEVEGQPVTYLEALTEIVIDPDWVYNKDRTERRTYKEQIEGVLSALNCTIKQSGGRWFITNASTYGGTTDSVTFDVYNVVSGVYVKGTSVTLPLRYNIDGTDTQDLVPSDDDLVLNTRRAQGSVECKPDGFYSEDVVNGGFEAVNDDATESPKGWTKGPTEGPLATTTDYRQAGFRSIFTTHNTFDIDSVNDVWFINTTGVDVLSSVSIQLSFDWLADLLITEGSQGVRNAVLSYAAYFVPDEPINIGELDATQVAAGGLYAVRDLNAGAFVYLHSKEEWYPLSSIDSLNGVGRKGAIAEGEDLQEWLHEDATLSPVRIWDYSINDYGNIPVGPGKFFVKFYFPRGQRPQGNGKHTYRGNGDDRMAVYVDNVSVENQFSNDISKPTFERVQADYTSTYTYEPGIASGTNDVLVQTVNPKSYVRKNVAADLIDRKSLEEIGTQLKLNDFRTNFKYYEGSLINLTGIPVLPHNKINVDWVNYSETASCIINGGKWDVKGNKFDVAMYVPFQINETTGLPSDVAPGNGGVDVNGQLVGFFDFDVDLVPMPFPGLSTKRTYSLNVVVDKTYDSQPTPELVPNGLVPVKQSFQWTASPGDEIQFEVILNPEDGYSGVSAGGATGITPDSATTPIIRHISNIEITNDERRIRIKGLLTMPEDSEFETLYIDGKLSLFTPDPTPGITGNTITFTRFSDPNIAQPIGEPNSLVTVIDVSGVAGDRKTIVYAIEAINAHVVQNIDEEHDDGLLSNGITVGNGTQGATITFTYQVVGTEGYNVDVEITGSTTGDPGGDIQIENNTLTITNNLLGVDVIDGITTGNTTVVPFVGVRGQEIFRYINIDPDSDKYIAELGTPSTTGDIRVETPSESGEDWKIPVYLEIIDENLTQPTMTIGADLGTVLEEPYSISFNTNNLGINNAKVSMPEYYVFEGTVPTADIVLTLSSTIFRVVYGTGVDVEVGDRFTFSPGFSVSSNTGLSDRQHNVISVDTSTNTATLDNPSEARDATGASFTNATVSGSIAVNRPFSKVSFDEGDFGDSFPRAGEAILVTVEPTGNHVFTSVDDIAIDINEAAATVTVDGVTNQRVLPEIQFSPGTRTLEPGGSIVFPITGRFPTLAEGGGQYVLDINILGSDGSNDGMGDGPTAARASQATTVEKLTPGIGAAGGTAQFRIIADGEWKIQNVNITLGGVGTITTDDGSFSEEFMSTTHTPPLEFTQRGSIGPLSGGAGEHIVTLTADAIGYASRLSGDTPQIFRPSDWEIDYIFNVVGEGPQGPSGGNPALKGTGVTQSGTYGSANIVYPGFTDATLMSASNDTGASNLIFFG